jgi:hypothetical protein
MTRAQLMAAIVAECKRLGFPKEMGEVFQRLRSHPGAWAAIQIETNRYQNHDNDLLFDLIHLVYTRNKQLFSPVFRYDIDPAVFDPERPRLCLGLHSKYSPLSAALIQKNQKFVVVSDYPTTVKNVVLSSGIQSARVRTISRDETCLLQTKRFLQQNHLVSSTIDFHSKLPGPYDRLSDSMLRLAKTLRPDTFLGINTVNDLGEMTYKGIGLDVEAGVEKMKKDVLGFLAEHKKKAKFQFDKFDYLEQTEWLKSMNAGPSA